MSSRDCFLHLRHGNGGQVFGKQHEQKEKQTEGAQHDPKFDEGGSVETPGMRGKTVGHTADNDNEAFPPHTEIDN